MVTGYGHNLRTRREKVEECIIGKSGVVIIAVETGEAITKIILQNGFHCAARILEEMVVQDYISSRRFRLPPKHKWIFPGDLM